MASPAYIPWELLCSLYMCGKPETCPLKPVPQAPGQVKRPLSRKVWECLCCDLGVVACQKLFLQLFQSYGTQKYRPPWPPKPGAQGVSAVGTVCVRWLQWGHRGAWGWSQQPASAGSQESLWVGQSHKLQWDFRGEQGWGNPTTCSRATLGSGVAWDHCLQWGFGRVSRWGKPASTSQIEGVQNLVPTSAGSAKLEWESQHDTRYCLHPQRKPQQTPVPQEAL